MTVRSRRHVAAPPADVAGAGITEFQNGHGTANGVARRRRVFIVDGDEQTRLSLLKLFKSANIDAYGYVSDAELVGSADLRATVCLLLETRADGFDVQED